MNQSGNPATANRCKRPITACLLCVLLLVMTACGQRGPLYLPDEHPDGKAEQQETGSENGEDDEETPGT